MEALRYIEIGASFPHVRTFDEEKKFEALRTNLNLVEEQRDRVSIQLVAYHKKVTNYYNSRVQNKLLKNGDLVLRKSIFTNAL